MNTSKNLAKHTYELLLSAINILVTFYCIYSKNMYIQYVVTFIMTFIAFLLFSAKRLSLKLYTACTIVVCLFLMLFLLCKRILYRHLKCLYHTPIIALL
ncbi:uncharacterized protein BN631_01796 [Amedibacillus dolichus CAG:375]|uniref:Uncharacterized protein n=1 Tax=Amedibacillus dolichus CAG:375 TaxID=1263076 RepID=R7G9C2_9FIRM|nr:uncharacterized protein BN631_01796 [Amedibacillus dolichus CAG:375]